MEMLIVVNSHWSADWLDILLVPLRHKLFWIPLYIFILLYIYYNFAERRWIIFLGIGLCILFSDTSSSKIIKPLVNRERPCHSERYEVIARVPCSSGYSFTSSHATNHFAISTFLFLLFAGWKYRWLFMAWASIICYAQVYVGVHYPLDVIFGALLGLLVGFLSFRLYMFLYNLISKNKNNRNVISDS